MGRSKGKRQQDAAFAAAGRVLPPSPYAADAFSFVRGIANGQNIQNAALSVVGQRALRQVRANAALAARLPKGTSLPRLTPGKGTRRIGRFHRLNLEYI